MQTMYWARNGVVGRSNPAQQLQAAQELVRRDRRRGLMRLDEIFRAGTPPDLPLDGRYAGAFVAFRLPLVSDLAESAVQAWRPWRGKTFEAAEDWGDNVVSPGLVALARLIWPKYRGYERDGSAAYRAFAFRTCVAPGLADPDRQVLRIDYDLAGNPRMLVRRVLDEVVQLDERLYLGKAHLRVRGRHWTWAYFMLQQ